MRGRADKATEGRYTDHRHVIRQHAAVLDLDRLKGNLHNTVSGSNEERTRSDASDHGCEAVTQLLEGRRIERPVALSASGSMQAPSPERGPGRFL